MSWTTQSKNTTTFTPPSKNTSVFTGQSKNTSSFTAETKHSSVFGFLAYLLQESGYALTQESTAYILIADTDGTKHYTDWTELTKN